MIIAETYKGYDIFESFGDHKAAGYKYQVALHGFLSGKYFGVQSMEHAKKEIDWLSLAEKDNE